MNILVFVTNSLLLLAGLSLAASDSGKSKNGKKPSEVSKDEKANAKLPPCAACGNLVASFEQVGPLRSILTMDSSVVGSSLLEVYSVAN